MLNILVANIILIFIIIIATFSGYSIVPVEHLIPEADNLYQQLSRTLGPPKKIQPATWNIGRKHKIYVFDSEYCLCLQIAIPVCVARGERTKVTQETLDVITNWLQCRGYAVRSDTVKLYSTNVVDMMCKYKKLQHDMTHCFYDIFMELYTSFSVLNQTG